MTRPNIDPPPDEPATPTSWTSTTTSHNTPSKAAAQGPLVDVTYTSAVISHSGAKQARQATCGQPTVAYPWHDKTRSHPRRRWSPPIRQTRVSPRRARDRTGSARLGARSRIRTTATSPKTSRVIHEWAGVVKGSTSRAGASTTCIAPPSWTRSASRRWCSPRGRPRRRSESARFLRSARVRLPIPRWVLPGNSEAVSSRSDRLCVETIGPGVNRSDASAGVDRDRRQSIAVAFTQSGITRLVRSSRARA